MRAAKIWRLGQNSSNPNVRFGALLKKEARAGGFLLAYNERTPKRENFSKSRATIPAGILSRNLLLSRMFRQFV